MGEREAQKPCETVKLTGSPMRRDYLLPGIQVLNLSFVCKWVARTMVGERCRPKWSCAGWPFVPEWYRKKASRCGSSPKWPDYLWLLDYGL